MLKAEFGIIDQIDGQKDYSEYEPEIYHCVAIDDGYLDAWCPRLMMLKTYFHSLRRPAFGLARYGVTLIPPGSLQELQDIVLSDKGNLSDDALMALHEKIAQAIEENKYLIHYGV